MSTDYEVVLEPPDDGDDLDVQIETALTGARQDVLDELKKLADQDKLDPESIAQRAQDPGNPLHRVIFAEDEATAAWRRRIELAKALVRRCKIVVVQVEKIVVEGGGTKVVRVEVTRGPAYVSIQDEDGTHRYRDTRTALAEDREQVLANLDREFRGWVERRRSILSLELDQVLDTVDSASRAMRAGE